jgi:hypothetical protein
MCKAERPRCRDPSQRHPLGGPVADDKKTGRGVMTFTDGSRIERQFIDGKLNGPGAETYNNGTRCVGQFFDGNLTGYCTFRDGTGVRVRNGQVLR